MTHHTDAELLRDIEEHMRKMWDDRLLPAVCWPADLAQRLTQAVRRAPAAPSAWKDNDTAKLVNDLRDCAVQYHATAQLRERIAHLVRPLAARLACAPAAPVPQEVARLRNAISRCADFIEHADVSSGVCGCGDSMEGHADPMVSGHVAVDEWDWSASCMVQELRAIIAAAPQPPVAAPVELPEPVAYRMHDPEDPELGHWLHESRGSSWHVHEPLYTEQQVRELLAGHGIGKDKA